ncbi:hypothetical protein FN846DRAFT_553494 [Sphaerosporella brunnea]|uniref:Uncharacterized protein n=1 Tax=Sphaerosporella brunnea TaxID=1250544 RepID=A0A5J5F246_9PEZI|nr:hypothetical protein FN846DRAFT_553494 [Sphaerosporella brunnea]
MAAMIWFEPVRDLRVTIHDAHRAHERGASYSLLETADSEEVSSPKPSQEPLAPKRPPESPLRDTPPEPPPEPEPESGTEPSPRPPLSPCQSPCPSPSSSVPPPAAPECPRQRACRFACLFDVFCISARRSAVDIDLTAFCGADGTKTCRRILSDSPEMLLQMKSPCRRHPLRCLGSRVRARGNICGWDIVHRIGIDVDVDMSRSDRLSITLTLRFTVRRTSDITRPCEFFKIRPTRPVWRPIYCGFNIMKQYSTQSSFFQPTTATTPPLWRAFQRFSLLLPQKLRYESASLSILRSSLPRSFGVRHVFYNY